ncbi:MULTISPECIES: N-acetylmuramate alpha-1-phosphate uridylyltransferase MurU [unclassified Guyparkeria]|uniref:N-acetylmuramate alpha-1-phosphate uridylyltransferase MurU n=1 Tax=unclassified Guyparkeria TaxID=2626246 RepID=UPI0007338FC1|nr:MULTISPECIES: nucleotidyltransferase family protein [unclassified Guyparkeria]KTG17143.1 mannose-1-phosphate guanylyltransferase [Guyparkeria sp. XI15]OAE86678.1 mannose-1-phosphate guanylyltransferase [Guyparkeria sp. WRN-7]
MILAAGRGERLRPLTDHTPKPLIEVGDRPLIEHHLERLAAAGITRVVINLAHLGEQIRRHLGSGERWGLTIEYSQEGERAEQALETAGGIRQALDRLGSRFLLINGDVLTDVDYADLLRRDLPGDSLAHLLLVDNPPHNPSGDFVLGRDRLETQGDDPLTYAGIGLFRRELFADLPPGRQALGPVLREAIEAGQVTGEHHHGDWLDVGTKERLAEARRRMQVD